MRHTNLPIELEGLQASSMKILSAWGFEHRSWLRKVDISLSQLLFDLLAPNPWATSPFNTHKWSYTSMIFSHHPQVSSSSEDFPSGLPSGTAMLVITRGYWPPWKIPWATTIFQCFSYSFPWIFLWFSRVFLWIFLWFTRVFLWFSCGFSIQMTRG